MIIGTKNIKKEEDNKIKDLMSEKSASYTTYKGYDKEVKMTPEDREFLEDLMLEQQEQM